MRKVFKYKKHFNTFLSFMLEQDKSFQDTLDKIEESKQNMLVLPLSYVKIAKSKHLNAYENSCVKLAIWDYTNKLNMVKNG